MCDTLVALGNTTADGSVILAKNSDRAPNEAQYPMYIPRTHHRETMVRCTHIEIPQVTETFAVLLSRPFWIWGCEMGANEFGVAIGNEAVFTKEPRAQTGLLGMDLMRLALERAETARRALDVIVELLGAHGQGGSCDIYRPRFSYHNSFILADPDQAWVLETAGRYWVAKQVQDVYSISNGLTIGADWDLASPGLVEHAIEKGWCKSESDFHFARCYSDIFYTWASACKPRHKRTGERLGADQGGITVEDMFDNLRDHGDKGNGASRTPDRGGITVCMHAANNLRQRSQSTASLVAHLRKELPVYWMTGTSAPCTGVFKPFYLGPVPEAVGEPNGTFDGQTLWWSHERLHRAVLADYAARMPTYEAERHELEAAFLAEERRLYEQYCAASQDSREQAQARFSSHCFERASAATRTWMERVLAVPVRRRRSVFYRRYWKTQNEIAGFAPGFPV